MPTDFSYNAEQQLLATSANEFFASRCSTEVVRELEESELGFSPDMWSEMADLGWLGITIPEAHGGEGGSFLDLLPLYDEMGRAAVPSPHLETVALAADIIMGVGTDLQRTQLLPAIAAGNLIIATAVLEPSGTFGCAEITMTAERSGDAFVLNGTKLLVPFANSADQLLVAARTGGGDDGVTLFLVDAKAAGISATRLRNIAGAPLFEVSFDGVAADASSVLGDVDAGWAAFDEAATKAAVLQTGTIVGAARAVLEMTNTYAKDRKQFGKAIGQYQAVQYMVSDILLDLHRAEVLAKNAAFRIDQGRDYAFEAATAIAFGKEAAAHFHRQSHEVFAGVGFMMEHDVTLFSRRSKYWEHNLGDARYHHEQLAVAMGLDA